MRCGDIKTAKQGKNNLQDRNTSTKTEPSSVLQPLVPNLFGRKIEDQNGANLAKRARPESSPAKPHTTSDITDIKQGSILEGSPSKSSGSPFKTRKVYAPFVDKLEIFSQEIMQLRKEKHRLWSLKAAPRPIEQQVQVSDIRAKLDKMKEHNYTKDFIRLGSEKDETLYFGGLDYSPDKRTPESYGYLKFSHGGYYLGGLSKGLPHGEGRELTKSGSLYIGQFQNGKKHGFGRLWTHSEQDGSIFFEGNFVKGKKDGMGMYITQKGYIYHGLWRSDFQEGQGAELFENGTFYSGNFSQGVKHGSGHLFTGRQREKVTWGSWVFGLKNGDFSVFDGQDSKPAHLKYRGGLPVI